MRMDAVRVRYPCGPVSEDARMPSDAIDGVVILTGRGGSGTRLLSQLADELGIFIGNRRNQSGDSMEWVEIIYRMAVEVEQAQQLPSQPRYRRVLRDKAEQVLKADAARGTTLWGLKLPETMLVLPLLIDAFPQAKVVHLIRHPISSSLRRTHMTSRPDTLVGAATLPNAYRYSKRDVALLETDEPYVHNACAWNYQVRRVIDYARIALADKYLEIRYEEMCSDPSAAVSRAGSFLGCAARASSIAVDSARVAGWDPDDPRIETIYEICGETAALLGYSFDEDALRRLRRGESAQKRE
jgi:Sulfotransferase family